jgi:hypothetical protein
LRRRRWRRRRRRGGEGGEGKDAAAAEEKAGKGKGKDKGKGGKSAKDDAANGGGATASGRAGRGEGGSTHRTASPASLPTKAARRCGQGTRRTHSTTGFCAMRWANATTSTVAWRGSWSRGRPTLGGRWPCSWRRKRRSGCTRGLRGGRGDCVHNML